MNRIRRTTLALSLAVANAASISTFAASAVDEVREGAQAQSRIRAQTKELATQIDGVLGEFQRNGIEGEDVAVLRSIRGVLYGLSDAQMQQVVDLLNKATASAASSDPATSRRSLTDAVLGQKAITNQLGQLLREYRRQQAMHDLSARFSKLSQRQDAGLKQSIALAKETAGKPPASMTPAQKEQLQVQQAEQAQMRDEVRQALADLAAVATDSAVAQQDRLAAAS
ncbi:MAG TPA: hypothetical protein VK324_08550, partial [Tepidisphaeraceae bacterium]|nr:hypothetical protein [Tepidisphaeraceae bacterium]